MKREVEHREARGERKRRARSGEDEAWTRSPKERDPFDEDAPRVEKLRRRKKPLRVEEEELGLDVLDPTLRIGERRESGLVVGVHRSEVIVRDGAGEDHALPFPHRAGTVVVGDAVLLGIGDDAIRLRGVEPRRSVLGRPSPGQPGRFRPIAANVDLALITLATPPSGRLRTGLVERVVLALEAGGVSGGVVVNKCDRLHPGAERDLEHALRPYRELGLPCLCSSALEGDGIRELRELIARRTVVFVGPSGVGKSSLANALDENGVRPTAAVRASDDKGRHTTTSSELVELEDGTRVIDTPGVRAFGALHVDLDTLRAAFPDLEHEALGCRFADCRHQREPVCGVKEAVESGRLDPRRLERWHRLIEEIEEER